MSVGATDAARARLQAVIDEIVARATAVSLRWVDAADVRDDQLENLGDPVGPVLSVLPGQRRYNLPVPVAGYYRAVVHCGDVVMLGGPTVYCYRGQEYGLHLDGFEVM